MEKDPFKEYLKESEPDKAYKGYAWSTAIGLQAVDGLKPSKYLIDTAIQNIEGNITMKEAQNLIDSYYKEKPVHLSDDERTEEADKVSLRIAETLSETAFSFSPNEYISKSATTSSTGGLILALKRAFLLLAQKGGIASAFTGPL